MCCNFLLAFCHSCNPFFLRKSCALLILDCSHENQVMMLYLLTCDESGRVDPVSLDRTVMGPRCLVESPFQSDFSIIWGENPFTTMKQVTLFFATAVSLNIFFAPGLSFIMNVQQSILIYSAHVLVSQTTLGIYE